LEKKKNKENKKSNNGVVHYLLRDYFKENLFLKMTVKNIESLEEFKGAIGGDKLVVVDFTATW
jgi:hypothetical protein